jgi:hypothetical protein
MKSYYFIIEVSQRNKLMSIIECEDFERVCKIVYKIKEKNFIAITHADCHVKISKAYVSSAVKVDLAYYACVDMQAVRQLIMEC